MKSGYTLIEFLIVTVLIGILFTIGYANFQDYSRQQAILAVVRSIQVDLRQAQEAAIAGNKPVGCGLYLNGYQFNVTSNTTYQIEAFCTGGNVTVKTVNIPAGITISAPNPNPITFKAIAQGTNIATGTSANIVITQTITAKTRTVTIGANGNVQ